MAFAVSETCKSDDNADESIYKLKDVGKFVIISQETFLPCNEKKTRTCAVNDALLLHECFSSRGFQIDGPHFNQTVKDIREIIKKVSHEDSVFGLFLGTHGGRGGLIHATDGAMSILDIILPICEKLPKEIPKIFFIQACRGGQGMPPHEESKGNKENDAEENEEKDAEENEEKDAEENKENDAEENEENDAEENEEKKDIRFKLPPHVLLVRSTVEGYLSFTNSGGSWMVQDITQAFGNYPFEEVITIITRANNALSDRIPIYDPEKKGKEEKERKEKERKRLCQVMSITSTLQKDLFLLPSEQ